MEFIREHFYSIYIVGFVIVAFIQIAEWRKTYSRVSEWKEVFIIQSLFFCIFSWISLLIALIVWAFKKK